MSRERSPGRLRTVNIIAGLQLMADAQEHLNQGNTSRALTCATEARGRFNESHAEGVLDFRIRAQRLVDEIHGIIQKELAGNA